MVRSKESWFATHAWRQAQSTPGPVILHKGHLNDPFMHLITPHKGSGSRVDQMCKGWVLVFGGRGGGAEEEKPSLGCAEHPEADPDAIESGTLKIGGALGLASGDWVASGMPGRIALSAGIPPPGLPGVVGECRKMPGPQGAGSPGGASDMLTSESRGSGGPRMGRLLAPESGRLSVEMRSREAEPATGS